MQDVAPTEPNPHSPDQRADGSILAPSLLLELFATQVQRTPAAMAVLASDAALSYQHLDHVAQQLAARLREHGVGPGIRVGLCMDRSAAMLIGILGILQAGGAYVPLDPTYPSARLTFMVADADCPLILAHSHLVPTLPSYAGRVVCFDKLTLDAPVGAPIPLPLPRPEDLAYVIYTSGSTGQPKGVLVPHRGLGNLAHNQIQVFGIQPHDRVLLFASSSFDASVADLMMALLAGATLVIPPADVVLVGETLHTMLVDQAITTVTLPPSVLATLPPRDLPALRCLIVAGEPCPPALVAQWAPGRRMFNAYGPTEVTVCATIAECRDPHAPLPIGWPIANTATYVLDAAGSPVPVGVPGELAIASIGLAHGYLNRPDVTAERFIPNPFGSTPSDRLYRTGDRVVERSDGALEYLGRIDFQTKIRGFRVELGEIESVLQQHPAVQSAVVVARDDDTGQPRLVAYVVPRPDLAAEPELWPSVAEYYVYDDILYAAMTNDERRNASYRVAFAQTVVDKIVVEIGTGKDAILARLALAAGARKVYAIEKLASTYAAAQERVLGLGLADRITVLHGDAATVDLPELADVCISEIVGAIGGSEGAACIINDARRFLKDGGAMIPERSVTRIAAVTLPASIRDTPAFTPLSAHYVDQIFQQVGYPFDLRVCIKHFPESHVLSTTGIFEDLDFTRPIPPNYTLEQTLTITQDGLMDGFLVWLNLYTLGDEVIDILAHEHCWIPVYLPIFSPPMTVAAGDTITLTVSGQLAENQFNLDYGVHGALVRPDGTELSFHYEAFHARPTYRATPFYRQLFVNDAIPVHEPDQAGVADQLKAALRERLPDYMVPATLVMLDALPLSPNGKVDRHALPAPPIAHRAVPTAGMPRTAIEATLARIWAEVLGLDAVSIHDNFFELGGDSILVIYVIARANQAGIALSTQQCFRYPTIASLAPTVTGTRTVTAEQGLVTGPVPLTPIQHWFFAKNYPMPQHWNQVMLLEVPAAMHPSVLEHAIQHILRHHDALRLRFTRTADGWTQWNAAPGEGQPFRLVNLAGYPAADQVATLSQIALETQASLDLAEGLRLRTVLFQLGPTVPARLLLTINYLAMDAVSWHILLADLHTAYTQLQQGEPVQLPAKTTSYQTWATRLAAYAQTADVTQHVDWWLSRADTPPLPRAGAGRNIEAVANTIHTILDADATSTLLHDVLRASNAQINDLLLTALTQTFARWTGQDRLVVDLEGHGREPLFEDVDVTRTVGWFTSYMPVALHVPHASTAGAAVRAVRDHLQQIPFHGISYGLLRFLAGPAIQSRLATLPQPEVRFNYLGQIDHTIPEGSGFRRATEFAGPPRSPHGERTHLLVIECFITAGQLHMEWTYSTELHDHATIDQLATDYLEILQSLMAGCLARKGTLTADESTALLDEAPLMQVLQRLARDSANGSQPALAEYYPLAPLQHGLLFHVLQAPASAVYSVQWTCELTGDLDVPRFRQAWEQVLGMHPALRTSVIWEGVDAPIQAVWTGVSLPWETRDWREVPPADYAIQLEAWLAADRQRGFDLTTPPLMRCCLIQRGASHYQFVWSFHHLILDGWSSMVVLNQVWACYQARGAGTPLPATGTPRYRDYVAWVHEQDLAPLEVFWRNQLNGFAIPTPLPFMGDQAVRTDAPASYAETWQTLPATTTATLHGLAQTHHLTISSILQGVWALLLHRHSGQADVVFGATVSGRSVPLPGIERMVGLLINTLPVRVRVEPDQPLVQWLAAVQQAAATVREYEHSPLVHVQRWSDVPAGLPVFNSVVNVEHYVGPMGSPQQRPSDVQVHDAVTVERTTYPLSLSIIPGTELRLKWIYDTTRVSPASIEELAHQAETILATILAHPQSTVASLPRLSTLERQRLFQDWNATAAPAPSACLHHLFEDQVALHPEAIALRTPDAALTYDALNRRANRLAHELRARGVRPETRVGLCVDRSPDWVIGILAILKAGGAFVPLDPAYPAERLRYMLQDSRLPIVLTQSHLHGRLVGDDDVALLALDTLDESVSRHPATNPPIQSHPDMIAYVIYTSGSTGRPKGVMVNHRGIGNLVAAQVEAFGVRPSDHILQFSALSFDASVFELAMGLLTGACLCLAPQAAILPGSPLLETLRTFAISIVTLPPSALAVLPPADLPALRTIIVAGEACPVDLARRWATGRLFYNAYGPTETTIWATGCAYQDSMTTLPIGAPIQNAALYILDEQHDLVPIGVAGELAIASIGLARGYLNRPDLTAERFRPHPFSTEPGARVYLTGDLGRYYPDGSIEYLGRKDQQVKIRGFRIEVEEIEAVLRHHPGVHHAVVLARTVGAEQAPRSNQRFEDHPGATRGGLDLSALERHLVGYVVPQAGISLTVADLRTTLMAMVPSYMVPAFFVLLDHLPLLPNGKVDRRALPAPNTAAHSAETPLVAPRTALEEQLAAMWAVALQHDHFGIHDPFLEVGGHSLLVTQVAAQMQQAFQQPIPMVWLLETPTIAGLAQRIAPIVAGEAHVLESEALLDLHAEAILDPTIVPAAPAAAAMESAVEAIFLTGATGFLGAFVLGELLAQTAAPIYCLVRAADMPAAQERLTRVLTRYRIPWQEHGSRIVPVCGDLTQPLLGLTEGAFQSLSATVDSIYHAGAEVNLLYPYRTLKPANVLGTQEVLRLACQHHVKPFHYVSTLSVADALSLATGQPVAEEDRIDVQHLQANGYVQSKWVAEQLVVQAGARGLPIRIYRPGRVSSHSQTGAMNEDDFLALLMKGCLQLGQAPDLPLHDPMLPVNLVSQAIVRLAQQASGVGTVFHLRHHVATELRQLFAAAQAVGYPLTIVPYAEWQCAVQRASDDPGFALAPVRFLFPASLSEAEWVQQGAAAQVSDHATRQTLDHLGTTPPIITASMIQAMLMDLIHTGFLAPPPEQNRSLGADRTAVL